MPGCAHATNEYVDMSSTVEIRRDGAVEWIRLNRPDALNAFNKALLTDLREALEAAGADPAVRVVVLAGAGRAFCAGGDLKEILTDLGSGTPGTLDALDVGVPTFDALRACPKPVLASVHGFATAGGFEVLLFCDLIFAASGTRMGDAHANYGLLPGGGGAAVLPKRVGLNRAKSLLFSGDLLPAETLKEWGLVHEVLPEDELELAVAASAQRLAERSPLVLRAMKEMANAALDTSEPAALRHELLVLRQHMHSHDMREGLSAFTEKRKPIFEGR